MRTIGRAITFGILGLLAAAAEARADSPDELAERMRNATALLSEMASGKQDTGIPREVLAKARAVAVSPQVKKGAVIVGGRHDQGVMSVKRVSDGRWSAPAFFEGANVQPDGTAIRTLYGAKADSRDVLLGGRYAVPTSARAFVSVLTTYSPPPKRP
jgi:lipid-binding SYLF domain-containing protein